MEPGRVVYWNVPEDVKTVFYILAFLSTAIFFYGIWTRISLWRSGSDEDLELPMDMSALNLFKLILVNFFSKDCFFARRVFERSRVRGIMLLFIVWSFMILFMGTILVTTEHYFNLNFFLHGQIYRWFSLILDAAGALLLIGTLFALLRRYLIKPERIYNAGYEDGIVLALLFLVVFFGFAVESLRLAIFLPSNMDYSPVGALFASVFVALLPGSVLLKAHLYAWILHFSFAFTFVSYIPYSKQFHMFAAQITMKAAEARRSLK